MKSAIKIDDTLPSPRLRSSRRDKQLRVWGQRKPPRGVNFLEIFEPGIELKNSDGTSSLAGFGSAKCSNEEAYLFQKLIRTGLKTNNVDHCTRLCHASSVAALLETIGSGAVTAPFYEVEYSEVIIVIGANPTENHPVAATFFKNAEFFRKFSDFFDFLVGFFMDFKTF